ncbi:MAG TPA: DUF2190 family protein [Planctomycetaceae bacterium]|nr:DUF2190 family protein [Planctomycetaceae bacterium]
MAQATFRHGNPLMVDYTPASDVSAGDVVVVGAVPHVAHLDIEANRLGALAAGGGVYDVTAKEALSAGDKVYWDADNNKVTKTAVAGKTYYCVGFIVPDSAASADGDTVRVQHSPDGSSISA